MNIADAERDVESRAGGCEFEGLIARCYTLDGFADECGTVQGLTVQSLSAGTVFTVSTRNSRYRVVVLDPLRRLVLTSGSRAIPEPIEGRLEGTTAGGSLLRLGWIGVGFRMELAVGDRRITTSHVCSITIDSVPTLSSAPLTA